jgi:rhodanese-related sulfurtransferase
MSLHKRFLHIGWTTLLLAFWLPVQASEFLVSTEWLEENIAKENLRIIEVSVEPGKFERGHIPGAVNFRWHTDLVDPVRRDIASRENFQTLLRNAGISQNTTVILYGDTNNWFAAWGAWVFDIYGVDNVKLLDGGRNKWEAEGRPRAAMYDRIHELGGGPRPPGPPGGAAAPPAPPPPPANHPPEGAGHRRSEGRVVDIGIHLDQLHPVPVQVLTDRAEQSVVGVRIVKDLAVNRDRGDSPQRYEQRHRADGGVQLGCQPPAQLGALLWRGAHQRHVLVVLVQQAPAVSLRYRGDRAEVHHVQRADRDDLRNPVASGGGEPEVSLPVLLSVKYK